MFGLFKKNQDSAEGTVAAPVTGKCIAIDQVADAVFSSKMMGDGFAIRPNNGTISSPVDGQVDNIFPTKHAVSFTVGELEILLHMGIDTVSLEGKPFTIHVNENTQVSKGDDIADVNLSELEANDKDKDMIIVFTNGAEVIENIDVKASGTVSKGDLVATIKLK